MKRVYQNLFFPPYTFTCGDSIKTWNWSDCEPNRANTGDVNKSHGGVNTTLIVTDQDPEKWEDGDQEEDLPVIAAEDASVAGNDISNYPQEGLRWPVLQKYPAWPFGNLQIH